jgi:hypothetical protein
VGPTKWKWGKLFITKGQFPAKLALLLFLDFHLPFSSKPLAVIAEEHILEGNLLQATFRLILNGQCPKVDSTFGIFIEESAIIEEWKPYGMEREAD